MTHVIKSEAGNRILTAVLTDGEVDIGDVEDLEVAVEEARAYACSLLDRIVSLGFELERVRTALASMPEEDVEIRECPVCGINSPGGRFHSSGHLEAMDR